MNGGFLGTQAPHSADVVLLLEVVMGGGLLMGARLARATRFRQHAWCQSIVVILNLTVIALTMAPSFRMQVLPRIPAKISRPYFALATAHAALGSITELAALYLLFAAGTRLLPQGMRVTRHKVWMRTVLVLWWLALFLGLATYACWYVPHLFD